jgi:hypothetical protein
MLALGFAVLIYILKTPTDFGFTPNTADLIFDFLDKWASAGAPALTLLAIIVALGIGVAGILQTRNIQRTEQQQRLLKEIEGWAKEVIDLIGQLDRDDSKELSAFRFRTEQQWEILKATMTNAREMGFKIDEQFGQTVEKALNNFEYLRSGVAGGGLKSNIYDRMENCKSSCNKIIESAGSLKFKDIR